MPYSRTQHGLTRVEPEPPTSGSEVRGINHQATALPSIESNHLSIMIPCVAVFQYSRRRVESLNLVLQKDRSIVKLIEIYHKI